MKPEKSDFFDELSAMTSCFEKLAAEKRPLFIYGMGNGAEKLIDALEKNKISFVGFFASDEFLRTHTFHGHRVHSLSEVESSVGDFAVVLAFACGYPGLIDKITELSHRHTLYVPDLPVVNDGILFDKAFLHENEDAIRAAYELFDDEQSRSVYINVLKFKISGDPSYLKLCETPVSENFPLLGLGGNEVYLDLGAYNGDTAARFINAVSGCFDGITAVEPDKKNFAKLEKYVASLPDEQQSRIRTVCAPIWSSECDMPFMQLTGRRSAIAESGNAEMRRTVSVDSLFRDKKVTFIKIDTEGAEAEAIRGGCKTIVMDKPKLAISVYHRSRDIFSIPLMIARLRPDYRFLLRHNPYIPAWDTDLYCI